MFDVIHLECDDDIDIAIASLPSSGGTLKLGSGMFYRNLPIVIGNKSIAILGNGEMSTILEFDFASELSGIYLNALDSKIGNLTIRNKRNMKYGLHLSPNGSYFRGESVYIIGPSDTGVFGESGNSQNMFYGFRITDAKLYGFRNYGGANVYNGCIVQNSVGSGFRTHESGSSYYGCVADKCNIGYEAAIYSVGVSFYGIHCEFCSQGILIASNAPRPSSIAFIGGMVYNSLSLTKAAIEIGNCEATSFMALTVLGSLCGISFLASGLASKGKIVGCLFSDQTPTAIDPEADVSIL